MIVSGVIISCEDRNLHHCGVVHGCTAASHAYTANSTPLPAASPAFQTGVNTSRPYFQNDMIQRFQSLSRCTNENPISKPISPRNCLSFVGQASSGTSITGSSYGSRRTPIFEPQDFHHTGHSSAYPCQPILVKAAKGKRWSKKDCILNMDMDKQMIKTVG